MRIIHNTTYILDETIVNEWIDFVHCNYIFPLQENNICDDILFTKVSIDQPEGKTYSLQLIFNSGERIQHFCNFWLPKLEKKIATRFLNKYVYFCSILNEVEPANPK